MEVKEISIQNIALDLENPRHEPYQSEDEVIDYLCQNESIYALAQDIVKIGINPLEVLALIPEHPDAPEPRYIVVEGNRRLCALKLLEDPERAPSGERKNFKELSARWQPVVNVPAILFEDREAVAVWLERIHGGTQGGIGRKPWNSEQKTRFTGDAKNLMAQQLLDYAQQKGMINSEERVGKLSTVQRFISNPLFRDALGLDNSKNDEIQRTRLPEDFDKLLRRFIHDLKNGDINTRSNAPQIKQYSHQLRNVEGVSHTTIPPCPLKEDPASAPEAKPAESPKPVKPAKPRYLEHQPATEQALQALGNYKLQHLYHSLHKLQVAEHCPLITIGLWAFIESLTALNGRKEGTDFGSYLSPTKLNQLGLNDKTHNKAIKQSLTRLTESGNTSKHDQQAASFNDQQLINDFSVLHPLIQALANATAPK